MIKIIFFVLIAVLITSYAFGWFSEVGLGDKTTTEFNAYYSYWWRSFFYGTYEEARDRIDAVRTSVSKPAS